MNVLAGRLETDGSAWWTILGDQRLRLADSVLRDRPALKRYADRDVIVGIRPEDMEDAEIVGADDGFVLRSVADLVEAMGSDVLVHFPIRVRPARTDETEELVDEGFLIALPEAQRQDVTTLVGRFSPRTRVFEGQSVTVRVDTARLHFFDPESGSSIWND
jgi:multiple sugar transport system ATP-binding protein